MVVKHLGLIDYAQTFTAMQSFTEQRDESTPDELWITWHESVFTHGISSTDKHIITPNDIPVVQTDRGGQITYHGIGQLVVYVLLDLRRLKLGVKKLVFSIEEGIIQLLNDYKINSERKEGAPGIYVEGKKIAALGLKIKNLKTYHGLSVNIDMDITPFSFINPCGYKDLEVCQMRDFINKTPNNTLDIETIGMQLCKHLETQIAKL